MKNLTKPPKIKGGRAVSRYYLSDRQRNRIQHVYDLCRRANSEIPNDTMMAERFGVSEITICSERNRLGIAPPDRDWVDTLEAHGSTYGTGGGRQTMPKWREHDARY